MAVAYLFELPGVTQAQYDQIIERVGRFERRRLFHVAGPTENGWRVVDVWESEEAFAEFVASKLGPAAAAAGVDPQASAWPVHNVIGRPAPARA